MKCISNSRKRYKAKENTWNFQSSAQLGALPQNQVLFIIDSIPPQHIMHSELKGNPGHEFRLRNVDAVRSNSSAEPTISNPSLCPAYVQPSLPSLVSTDSCTIISLSSVVTPIPRQRNMSSAYQVHLPYAGDLESQELSGNSIVGRKRVWLV